jgi:hypothetical protein
MNKGKKVHGSRQHLIRLVRLVVVCRGTWPWDRELGHDAEVVARPHAVYRLVEEALAGGDVERGTMAAAAGLRTPAPHHRGHLSRALQLSLSARNSSHVRRPTACSGARLAPARNTRAALPGSQSGTIGRRR